jgi:hypothetical protein
MAVHQKMPTTHKRSSAATGKSKVISSKTLTGVRGGSTKMFGKQTVKAAKSR